MISNISYHLLFLALLSCGPAGEISSKSYKCMAEGENCGEGIGEHGDKDKSRVQTEKETPNSDEEGKNVGCTVREVENGAEITCGSTKVVILNGGKGADGKDAPDSAYQIIETIDPCGDAPGQYDEVLLRMANRQLLAHYSDGQKQFLVLIGPGNYKTTDNTNCLFTIDNNLNIINEHY